ncbi:MAG: hypothetical protein HY791_39825 [Deltaproteobacteria bacterium]|nr:hypothetical protein [Deltaproteobacteria bacterium]
MADGVATNRPTENLGGRMKDLAVDTGKTVLSGANTAGDKGMTALGEGLDKAASFVESKVADRRVDAITSPVHNAAEYLKKKDPESAITDLDQAIHNHPYRAMAVALGIGWVIGRLMRSSDR